VAVVWLLVAVVGLALLVAQAVGIARRRRRAREWDAADAEALAVLRSINDQGEAHGPCQTDRRPQRRDSGA
jgi:hypothetical protein